MLAATPRAAATSEDADVETSSDAYARRFAGPVGDWFLAVQARHTADLVAPWPGARVLDVGGGHAQSVAPLLRAGCDVTVLGSHESCARRLLPWLERGDVRFQAGSLTPLPFPDAAFDLALAYRLLAHVADWRRLLAELARVARRAVLVDYPTRRSANAVAETFFRLKHGVEGDTRPYTVFRDRDLAEALRGAGLRVSARRGQFFFPMALHRALGRAGLSRGLEAAARGLGLVRAFGSPVILRAERA